MNVLLDKIKGSLIWGAYGDALGYPVEFLRRKEILRRYGSNGISNLELDPHSGKALISDDTQMTLFTADAICSHPEHGLKSNLYKDRYKLWYVTQTHSWDEIKNTHERMRPDYILSQKRLYSCRAPGSTCLEALGTGNPVMNSKGCGAVVRAAPCGLAFSLPRMAFLAGVASARVTHGHPTGYCAAGALSALITAILRSGCTTPRDLYCRVNQIIETCRPWPEAKEVKAALLKAITLSDTRLSPIDAISILGGGWTAEEALAIAVYCALVTDNPYDAVRLAVNHSGDSDSTGAICGNIVGALYGRSSMKLSDLAKIEMALFICKMAKPLYDVRTCAL